MLQEFILEIKEFLRVNKRSQKWLADESGVNPSTINKILKKGELSKHTTMFTLNSIYKVIYSKDIEISTRNKQ